MGKQKKSKRRRSRVKPGDDGGGTYWNPITIPLFQRKCFPLSYYHTTLPNKMLSGILLPYHPLKENMYLCAHNLVSTF
jgi:hypothetical protein